MRPVRASTSSTKPSRCAGSSRSAALPNARPPAASIRSTVSPMVPGKMEVRYGDNRYATLTVKGIKFDEPK